MDIARILFVTHRADRSGAPRCVIELVRGLDRDRFECRVVLGEEGPVGADLELEGIQHQVRTKASTRGIAGLVDAFRCLTHPRPGLVHVNRAVGMSKTYALAARLLGIPVVWHLHDEFANRRLRRRLPWIRRLATRIVSCSEAAIRDVSLDGVTVIPNGTRFDGLGDRQTLCREAAQAGVGPSPFRFLFVGTVVPRKNVHLLAESAGPVLERFPDTDFLVVGGGDDPDYRERVVQQAAALDLGPRFQLVGEQSHVAPFYAASNALVLPSSSEAFPLVVLEAAAHEVPVIASAVGELPDVIRHGDTGWLMERDSINAARLAELLLEVRAEGTTAVRRVGRTAREFLQPRFGRERYVHAFAALYEEVLGLGGRARSASARG